MYSFVGNFIIGDIKDICFLMIYLPFYLKKTLPISEKKKQQQ